MNVLLGISASIAAYKAPLIVRELKKRGLSVQTLLSKNAHHFVTPLSLSTVSELPCLNSDDEFQGTIPHLAIGKEASLMVIAPATANMIAKCANGFADDMISSTFLAYQGPKLIVPAMHTEMIENPVVKENLNRLKAQGCYILGPISGELACNDKGPGRLIGIPSIVDAIENLAKTPQFKVPHERLLVTAGGTKEAIDSVRSLTNQASGQLGNTLANLAALDGKKVTLVSTTKPEDLSDLISHIHVSSAKEMEDAVMETFPSHDSLFMTAAVSDFKCSSQNNEKLSRQETKTLSLTQTNDILKTVASSKTSKQTVVGFCLEHEKKLEEAALRKVTEKNVDFLIANTPNNIGSSTRDFGIYTTSGKQNDYTNQSIVETANIILNLKKEIHS